MLEKINLVFGIVDLGVSTGSFFFFLNRWAYAIHGILEVNVCPRLRMWSWKHIRDHRQKMKQYREFYKKKLTSKKPSPEILMSLEVSILKQSLNTLLCIISP